MYKAQYFRDVNSYVWIPEDESKGAKLKGCFDPNPEVHKNHSQLIVPKALAAFYTKNIPVETTIKECTDIYDFCKMVKAKGCKFVAERYNKDFKKQIKKQGKVVRYYVTTSKGHHSNIRLMKYLPPLKKETYTEKWKKHSPNQIDIFDVSGVKDCKINPERIQHVEASNPVELFNKFVKKSFDKYKVDYNYYINECNKIIKAVQR